MQVRRRGSPREHGFTKGNSPDRGKKVPTQRRERTKTRPGETLCPFKFAKTSKPETLGFRPHLQNVGKRGGHNQKGGG